MKFSKTLLKLALGSSGTEGLPSMHKALGSWVQYPVSQGNTTTITINTTINTTTITINTTTKTLNTRAP